MCNCKKTELILPCLLRLCEHFFVFLFLWNNVKTLSHQFGLPSRRNLFVHAFIPSRPSALGPVTYSQFREDWPWMATPKSPGSPSPLRDALLPGPWLSNLEHGGFLTLLHAHAQTSSKGIRDYADHWVSKLLEVSVAQAGQFRIEIIGISLKQMTLWTKTSQLTSWFGILCVSPPTSSCFTGIQIQDFFMFPNPQIP